MDAGSTDVKVAPAAGSDSEPAPKPILTYVMDVAGDQGIKDTYMIKWRAGIKVDGYWTASRDLSVAMFTLADITLKSVTTKEYFQDYADRPAFRMIKTIMCELKYSATTLGSSTGTLMEKEGTLVFQGVDSDTFRDLSGVIFGAKCECKKSSSYY